MFSFVEKLIDKIILRWNFFNRKNSPSQSNESGDNIGRDKNVFYASNQQTKKSIVICAWAIPEQHQENDKILVYEFTPTLQNKSENIISDFWINFSTSGFNLDIGVTEQTKLFEGWNFGNEALNLVAKIGYRLAPQNLLHPFKIKIVLKKGLIPDHDAWIYLSFGATDVKMVEIKTTVTQKQLEEFVASSNHSTEAFLKLLGIGKRGFNIVP